jgi:ParB-like chromosome segregation protein Spo0J
MSKPEPLFWKTEKRKVSDLIPYEQNPRTLSKKQAEDLKQSLERFNLVEIPVVDTGNRIIAGHQRLKIMQMIGRGEEEIEVRVPCRDLTDDEFREYLIRSNKNTGSWDFDLLANAFDTEELVEWGFDLKEFGINESDPGKEPTIKDTFEVIVECSSEKDMQIVFSKLQAEGYKCRPLIF